MTAWQDWSILLCQLVMLVAMWPTIRDRARWPHPATAGITGAALGVMSLTLFTLALHMSGVITAALALLWARMAFR